MYEVFVNDKQIILSDKLLNIPSYDLYLLDELRIEEILYKLRHSDTKGVCVYHDSLSYLWEQFTSNFEVVLAAGGLVVKDNERYLLIYRNGRWDLPKGKMEKGENEQETALREVEEECGVSGLEIIKSLDKSYHIFYENGIDKLKQTSWFLMKTVFNELPIPQKEEGISKVEFVTKKIVEQNYKDMYLNIQYLLKKNIESIQ